MHHYPFHPGDYMLDTAHLEPLEDLAYRRLLDLYYTQEGPIADENQKLSKRLRLGFEVINQVLSEFFFLENGFWKNARCDAEIAAYQRKKAKLSENGKQGGRPKKSNAKANAKQKETKSLASACNQNQELEPEPIINTPVVPKGTAWNPTPEQVEVASWFNRRPSTEWSEKEIKAWKSLSAETVQDGISVLASPYAVKATYTRRDLVTLLHNWRGEIDRWRGWKPPTRSNVTTTAMQEDETPWFEHEPAATAL